MLAKRETSLNFAPPRDTSAQPRPAGSTPLLSWSEQFNVGVESIDQQHKSLVEMFNQVHSGLHAENSDQAMMATFARMAEFTASHFRHEEELMRRTQYPDAETHISCHANLLRSLDRYQQDLSRQCSANAMSAHLQMLRDWLVRHIQVQDRDLGGWLNRDSAP